MSYSFIGAQPDSVPQVIPVRRHTFFGGRIKENKANFSDESGVKLEL